MKHIVFYTIFNKIVLEKNITFLLEHAEITFCSSLSIWTVHDHWEKMCHIGGFNTGCLFCVSAQHVSLFFLWFKNHVVYGTCFISIVYMVLSCVMDPFSGIAHAQARAHTHKCGHFQFPFSCVPVSYFTYISCTVQTHFRTSFSHFHTRHLVLNGHTVSPDVLYAVTFLARSTLPMFSKHSSTKSTLSGETMSSFSSSIITSRKLCHTRERSKLGFFCPLTMKVENDYIWHCCVKWYYTKTPLPHIQEWEIQSVKTNEFLLSPLLFPPSDGVMWCLTRTSHCSDLHWPYLHLY